MEPSRLVFRIPTKIRATHLSDLVSRIKDLTAQGKLDSVQDLLLKREFNLTNEIQSLRIESGLLKKTRVLLEAEKLKCKESKELRAKALIKLMETQDICKEKIIEKNEEISGLNKELAKLKDQLLESDKILEVCFKQFNFINHKLPEVVRELEQLKGDKLFNNETKEKLRHQTLGACNALDKSRQQMGTEKLRFEKELKCSNLEASGIIEEVTRKNFESSQIMEELKRKLSESAVMEKRKFDEALKEMSHNNKLEVDLLNTKLQSMESEINELQDEKVLDARNLEEMRLQNLEVCKVKRELEDLEEKLLAKETEEKLRHQNSEDCKTIEKFSQQVLEMETEKLTLEKELMGSNLKASGTIQELTHKNLEASQMVEALKRKLSEAADMEKRKFDEALEEISHNNKSEVDLLNAKLQSMESDINKLKDEKALDARNVGELRLPNVEACEILKKFDLQIMAAAEVEKKKSNEKIAEMRLKELELEKTVKELRWVSSEASKRGEDLERRLLEADWIFKEVRRLSLDNAETIQNVRHNELKTGQAASVEVGDEKCPQDVIVILDSDDDDETEHGRSARILGSSSTNLRNGKACKKILFSSQSNSPCTPTLKRSRSPPGEEEEKDMMIM